jgi:import inner membrane translocase subunit TIM13
MDSLGGMSSYPSDPKTAVMRQVQQEAAMQNARMLVEVRLFGACCLCIAVQVILTPCKKLNEHCFERCIPKPAASLSKGEESCMSACMEKYMSAWNTVSKQYVGRIQRESAQGGAVQNL